ncbi:MAG TPA: TonB-dependent receptor [Bryobacteraceae bacterium]|nr:TonB-dependent receptor [Bryobacteraceae bacterium]
MRLLVLDPIGMANSSYGPPPLSPRQKKAARGHGEPGARWKAPCSKWMTTGALTALVSGLAFAQGTGSVHGVVRDAGGLPQADAQVMAKDGGANADKVVTSGANGSFVIGDLKPGHYQLKATKPGWVDSAAVEQDIGAAENRPVELTLGAHEGFLKRLAHAYQDDWHPSGTSGPAPPRRALASPLNSPPFPNADWSYGGSPVIGEPDTNAPPLMQALYGGANGNAWEKSRVKIYGWLEGSVNFSTSQNSNYPTVYDIFPNRAEFDQAVVYIERIPDSVQTDHFDWGFHVSGLFGTSYRFTTNLGYFSSQLLDNRRQYGFDPVLEYVDLYVPQVGEGLNIRVGRFISIPGIEAQLAPNNYVYTHSLLYGVDPFTDTGILGTIRLNERLLLQVGLTAGHDVAPWTKDARPSADLCVSYTFNSGKDNVYPCANGINSGRYAYNNIQMLDNTWYHKFNDSWHMATEAWFMYQRNVPNVSGPITPEKGTNGAVCAPGQIRCFAPEWAMVNYVEKQLSPRNYVSIRTDFLDDVKGQRTGIKDRYTEATLMWGHWVGSTILLRPELRFDHAIDRPGYDNGTRRNQFQFAMDVIFKY